MFDYLAPQAATQGHTRRLFWLLAHGANPNARSTYTGRSCHQAALVGGHLEIAKLLVEHGATVEPVKGRDAFIAACARNDAAEAEKLLDNHRDYLEFVQPLCDAASAGKVETVELLLRLGMNPNGAGIHGHRALHVGCRHLAVSEVLLEHGADPRSLCFGGSVAGWARHAGDLDAARHYAEKSRSLLDAALSGHVELARELLETNPACLNERSPSGNGPLHELTSDLDRAKALIPLLLSYGADANALNQAGQTPAQRLTELGLDEIADALDDAVLTMKY
jgi:ankyrin repeat protein